MSNVLLIVQLLISVILTVLILLQRSDGGALGIGGGGGGGFMSGRTAANSLSRMTTIIGGLFFVNSLALSIVFNMENQDAKFYDENAAEQSLTIDTDSGETIAPSIKISPEAETADETPAQSAEDETETTSETPKTE